MTTTDPARATLTARLRHMADWLDAHPGIPVTPYASVVVHYFPDHPSAINDVQHAALDSHWERTSNTWDLVSHYIDDVSTGPSVVEYRLSIKKPEAEELSRARVDELARNA